jgi:hypothetical protein
LVAAADSRDHIGQDDLIIDRLEKIADDLGANIFGAWHYPPEALASTWFGPPSKIARRRAAVFRCLVA